MSGFVTEAMIIAQVRNTLVARCREEDEKAKAHEEAGETYTRKYHPALIETAQYQKWIRDRIDSMRERGLLVTTRQLEDIQAKRPLREGDRVRYIGPTRIELTRDGRNYTRETGQEGRIVRAVKGSDTLYQYIFLPDYPKEALDKDGPTVLVAQYAFRERSTGYFQIERLVEGEEAAA